MSNRKIRGRGGAADPGVPGLMETMFLPNRLAGCGMQGMPLPFDLEDVAGVAMVDLLRRVGMLAVVVIGGTALGGFAVGIGEMVAWRMESGSWDPEYALLPVLASPLLVLRPVISNWGFLYVPFLIAAGIYFVKAVDPGLRGVAGWLMATGFFAVVGRGEPAWLTPSILGALMGATATSDPAKLQAVMTGIGLLLWVGLSGAGVFLAFLWEGRRRTRAELHLMGIAMENERKRWELQAEAELILRNRELASGDRDADDGETR